jgi:hypothetical protein
MESFLPTPDEVERVLYIALREETDAWRNMVLPILNETPSRLIHVRYHDPDQTLHLKFFDNQEPIPGPRIQRQRSFQRLVQQYSWIYAWEGSAVGPVRISPPLVAALEHNRVHASEKARRHTAQLVNDSLIAFVRRHLRISSPSRNVS